VVLGLRSHLLYKTVCFQELLHPFMNCCLLETASLMLTELPFYTVFHTWTHNVLPPVEIPSFTTYHTCSTAYGNMQKTVMANSVTVLSIIKLHVSLFTVNFSIVLFCTGH
jgi:hypothetical protein